jgi:hypothetical protein
MREKVRFQISLVTFQPLAWTGIDKPSGSYLIRQPVETHRTHMNGVARAGPNLINKVPTATRTCVLNERIVIQSEFPDNPRVTSPNSGIHCHREPSNLLISGEFATPVSDEPGRIMARARRKEQTECSLEN